MDTIPCDVCGSPTLFKGTKRCSNCEGRLEKYLEAPEGVRLVMSAIGDERALMTLLEKVPHFSLKLKSETHGTYIVASFFDGSKVQFDFGTDGVLTRICRVRND